MGIWGFRLFATLLVLGTVLSLIPTGAWYIRIWDFPRFQLAVCLLLLAIFAWALGAKFIKSPERLIWISILVIAAGGQLFHVIHFTPIWVKEVRSSQSPSETLSLLVVNLDYENNAFEPVKDEILKIDADLLILIEVDDEWNNKLEPLHKNYPYRENVVRTEGLGLCLWSKLQLDDVQTKYLVEERRPSIWARLNVGKTPVNLVAIHPTPPGLDDSTGESRRDSRTRDAELVLIAKHRDENWIVAGDFNDVAWSHTTRLFKRLSGMNDPRVGRTFMGTFHAKYPLLRFPIDQIMLSDAFTLDKLERHPITGSDHFGVLVQVGVDGPTKGVTPEPQGNDQTDANEIVEEGKEDAQKRGILEEDD